MTTMIPGRMTTTFTTGRQPHEQEPPSILSLPVEILEKIFLYLDPAFLLNQVRLVCRMFCSVLNDETLWRKQFHYLTKKITSKDNAYPLLGRMGLYSKGWKCGLDLLWRDMAVQFDSDMEQWVTSESYVSKQLKAPHYAAVDTVHLINDGEFCISGGRDRLLVMWGVETMNYLTSCEKSHSGWVWDLDSYEKNYFFSCGWDSNVIMWNLHPSGLRPVQNYRCENPIVTLACKPGLVACGLIHDPRIVLIDPRIQLSNYKLNVQIHKGAITDLAMNDNILISGSEDKTIAVYDLRMHKLVLEHINVSVDDSFARSIGISNNIVYVGDTRGNIHVFDANHNYERVQLIQFGLNAKHITAICPRLGSIIVGSTDKKIRFVVPTEPASIVKELSFGGEVTSVDYKRNVLAVGGTDNSVTIFQGNKL